MVLSAIAGRSKMMDWNGMDRTREEGIEGG